MMENKNRTIESILDLQEDIIINAEEFFSKNIDELFKWRRLFETYIQKNQKRFVCRYCKQYIKIRAIDSKVNLHFAHLKDSDSCILKTDNRSTREQIDAIKFNGAKESKEHIELKSLIYKYLEMNKKCKEIIIEKVQRDKATKDWRKPDIKANYKDLNIVIELQLSTTYLSVITAREEFYKRNEIYTLWVFNKVEKVDNEQTFTQMDIFYNNNYNAFEFDHEAIKKSIENRTLFFNCHFHFPYIDDSKIKIKWESELISIDEVSFDSENFKVFYFDYEKRVDGLNEFLDKSQFLPLLRVIMECPLYDLLNKLSLVNPSKNEIPYLNKFYKQFISPLKSIRKGTLEVKIIWTMIFHKLKKKGLVLNSDYSLKFERNLIWDLLCLKLNKVVGYNLKNLVQIVHNRLNTNPESLHYILKAIKVYNSEILKIDKTGKLSSRIEKIKKSDVKQEKSNKFISAMFPDLEK